MQTMVVIVIIAKPCFFAYIWRGHDSISEFFVEFGSRLQKNLNVCKASDHPAMLKWYFEL